MPVVEEVVPRKRKDVVRLSAEPRQGRRLPQQRVRYVDGLSLWRGNVVKHLNFTPKSWKSASLRQGLTWEQIDLISNLMKIPGVVSVQLAANKVSVVRRRKGCADPERVARLLMSLVLESELPARAAA